ncbi:hypothetical protein [Brumicola pallidula]|uniref:Uncharacterized protein n=1 Tax=Brumicola pallidula DSM 14239 = ACAM 615 TaxID=1121922 RepID=K6ZY63_9ALTE|nr:hypothetical protein [Glaciecola pallidula]GAC28255.1 hypothetical protein GPAL_1382 [Glaciecola pallidula DSM 14239 = ACAM 615]
MKFFTLSLMVLVSINVPAADESFNWLKSTSNQNSTLSGTCDYINARDLKCNLRQIQVKKKTSPEDVLKSIQEMKDEVYSKLQNQTVEEFRKSEFNDFCSQLDANKDQVSEGVYTVFNKMCKETSKDTIIDALSYTVKIEGETCNVKDFDLGDSIFERVNENKWVSTNGPSGECGTVAVLSIEREPDHQFLWNYAQVRHYTNTETELCKQFVEVNEPMSYSWKGKSPIEMSCKFIEFGF